MVNNKHIFKAVSWTAASSLANTVIIFIRTLILTKFFLSPNEFGVLSILMVIINISTVLLDFGINNAIIQSKEINKNQLSTLYWINLMFGGVIFIILCLSAPLVARFYEAPSLTENIYIVAIIYLVVPIGLQYKVLKIKALEFNAIAKVEILAYSLGLLVTVVFATWGWGIKAVALGIVVQHITIIIPFTIKGLRFSPPTFHFSLKEVKALLRFGFYDAGALLVNTFSSNLDKIIIGKLLGPQILGFYELAWNIIIMPLRKINPVLTRVLFPVLARVQSDESKFQNFFLQTTRVLLLINVPILIGVSIVAYPFIELFFGKQWVVTAQLLPILAFVCFIRTLGNPGGSVMLARGKSQVSFWWNIGWTIGMGLINIIYLSYYPTAVGSANAQLIAGYTVGLIWPYLLYVYGRISVINALVRNIPILFSGIIMMLGVLAIQNLITVEALVYSFIIQVASGMGIYLMAVLILYKKGFISLKFT